jgi:hypothetical protein
MRKTTFVSLSLCATICLIGCASLGEVVYTDRASSPEGAFEFTLVNECPWQLTLGTGFSAPRVNGNGGAIKLFTLADGSVRLRFYGPYDSSASGINIPGLSGARIDPLTEDGKIIIINYESAKGGYTFYTK